MCGDAHSCPPRLPGARPRTRQTGPVSDWENFLAEVPWFLPVGEAVTVGAERPWHRGGVAELPELSRLLEASTVTPIKVRDKQYELIVWGAADKRRGWLTTPPLGSTHLDVHAVQRSYWTLCGGIVEQFGPPVTWWTNLDQVLTVEAARTPLVQVLDDYRWLWADEGLEMPIDPSAFSVVGIEANGNLTIAHRLSGELLLFAPDHAFDGVTPLPGCPPYSLLTIDAAPDVSSWIEVSAQGWRSGEGTARAGCAL